ncbi:MAG TPA: DUF4189 domain-containing protein [Candidatus Dormibacteraeota bacterium]|nr:DUF4189 domain-containing protein [Candidatus Dormibacteraeota bacterium]
MRFFAIVAALGILSAPLVADAGAPYGAIASYGSHWGYSVNRPTKAIATSHALAACQRHATGSCHVHVWFSGHGYCGALAAAGNVEAWGIGRGRARAEARALSSLHGGRIIKSVCNR